MERALHRNLIIDKVQKLEKKERDIIRRAVGSCEYPDIISFLLQKCHVQDPGSLSLEDIIAHCKQYLRREKKKGILRKIPRWIYYILGTLAALVGILHRLGWL